MQNSLSNKRRKKGAKKEEIYRETIDSGHIPKAPPIKKGKGGEEYDRTNKESPTTYGRAADDRGMGPALEGGRYRGTG